MGFASWAIYDAPVVTFTFYDFDDNKFITQAIVSDKRRERQDGCGHRGVNESALSEQSKAKQVASYSEGRTQSTVSPVNT